MITGHNPYRHTGYSQFVETRTRVYTIFQACPRRNEVICVGDRLKKTVGSSSNSSKL